MQRYIKVSDSPFSVELSAFAVFVCDSHVISALRSTSRFCHVFWSYCDTVN
jgi:hypothetical protein